MFLVNDTLAAREDRICRFLTETDAPFAVLGASAHFEWIIGRAILALGNSPTSVLRKSMAKSHGLDDYKEFWRDEVMPGREIRHLPGVIPDWAEFRHAFKLRHVLIHGRKSVTLYYARIRVPQIVMAARGVNEVAMACGIDLFSRLSVRRKYRVPPKSDALNDSNKATATKLHTSVAINGSAVIRAEVAAAVLQPSAE